MITDGQKHRADSRHVLGAVLYAVGAVPVLQVTGRSVGVENTQVFWTINACRGNNHTETLIWKNSPVIFDLSVTHTGGRTGFIWRTALFNFVAFVSRGNGTTEAAQFKVQTVWRCWGAEWQTDKWMCYQVPLVESFSTLSSLLWASTAVSQPPAEYQSLHAASVPTNWCQQSWCSSTSVSYNIKKEKKASSHVAFLWESLC